MSIFRPNLYFLRNYESCVKYKIKMSKKQQLIYSLVSDLYTRLHVIIYLNCTFKMFYSESKKDKDSQKKI